MFDHLQKNKTVMVAFCDAEVLLAHHLMSITYATESSACQLWLEHSTQLKTLVSVLMVLARL
jgi:hypothetical protein